MKNDMPDTEQIFYNNSNITEWLTTFTADAISLAKDYAKNNPGCSVNPYYSIEIVLIVKRIISILLYFPLYSNVIVPIFKTGSLTATSSAVEVEFNDCKHRLLKNISRSVRVDKFITLHLQSFSSRINQQWQTKCLKLKKNKQF